MLIANKYLVHYTSAWYTQLYLDPWSCERIAKTHDVYPLSFFGFFFFDFVLKVYVIIAFECFIPAQNFFACFSCPTVRPTGYRALKVADCEQYAISVNVHNFDINIGRLDSCICCHSHYKYWFYCCKQALVYWLIIQDLSNDGCTSLVLFTMVAFSPLGGQVLVPLTSNLFVNTHAAPLLVPVTHII